MPNQKLPLKNYVPPINIKLSALWASLMFLYIYADYFMLFMKGHILKMNDGIMGPLGPATPQIMLGVSVLMIIPSLMIAACIILPPKINRIVNILFGVIYTLVIFAAAYGDDTPFWILFSVIEMAITLAICYFAFKWPRETQ
ncbi:MAG: hypothetical protein FD163_1115 [Hyphomonadaceae bacterium]|nr:MAG: hypothetical protein FD128_1812 [Hyphomonadaceae bacterium]KAF0185300.1 MAG: hypothetical protein FD163_1115 [Hyphomonadaceae bacterium]